MPAQETFQLLMDRLRKGDDESAARVFRRFADRLVALARRQFDTWVVHKSDPEGVVQSVYKSFFLRYQAGEFSPLDWDDLWSLLVVITLRKCTNRNEYLRAARRDVAREVGRPGADGTVAELQVFAREPTPDEAAILTDTVEYLMRGLEAHERAVLVLHLQGYTLREVSAGVGRSQRTVRRTIERVRRRLQRLQAREGATEG